MTEESVTDVKFVVEFFGGDFFDSCQAFGALDVKIESELTFRRLF